jgi:hypothetical protein
VALRLCPKCNQERPEELFRDEKGQRRVKCNFCNAGRTRRKSPATKGGKPKAQVIDGKRYCASGASCVGGVNPGSPNQLSRYNRDQFCYSCRDARVDQSIERAS